MMRPLVLQPEKQTGDYYYPCESDTWSNFTAFLRVDTALKTKLGVTIASP